MMSRKSTTPRATLVKCPTTDRRETAAPNVGGRPMRTTGVPISTRKNDTDAATMNAVIWFRVRLEAQRPTATPCAASRPAPMYSATMMPASASDTMSSPTAVGTLPASAMSAKIQFPMNLPAMTSASPRGWARSHSRVPLRRSSASERMVMAGMKTAKSQGSMSKKGRMVAIPAA